MIRFAPPAMFCMLVLLSCLSKASAQGASVNWSELCTAHAPSPTKVACRECKKTGHQIDRLRESIYQIIFNARRRTDGPLFCTPEERKRAGERDKALVQELFDFDRELAKTEKDVVRYKTAYDKLSGSKPSIGDFPEKIRDQTNWLIHAAHELLDKQVNGFDASRLRDKYQDSKIFGLKEIKAYKAYSPYAAWIKALLIERELEAQIADLKQEQEDIKNGMLEDSEVLSLASKGHDKHRLEAKLRDCEADKCRKKPVPQPARSGTGHSYPSPGGIKPDWGIRDAGPVKPAVPKPADTASAPKPKPAKPDVNPGVSGIVPGSTQGSIPSPPPQITLPPPVVISPPVVTLPEPPKLEAPVTTGMGTLGGLPQSDQLSPEALKELASASREHARNKPKKPIRFTCKTVGLGACDAFQKKEKDECLKFMRSYISACEAGGEYDGSSLKTASCTGIANFCRVQINSRRKLVALTGSARASATRHLDKLTKQKVAGLKREAAKFQTESEELKGQRQYYYLNANSGEMMVHAGTYFDPKPPLTFVGDAPLRLSRKEKQRTANIAAEIAALEARMRAVSKEATKNSAWPQWNTQNWSNMQADPCLTYDAEQYYKTCQTVCEYQNSIAARSTLTCHPPSKAYIKIMIYLPGTAPK